MLLVRRVLLAIGVAAAAWGVAVPLTGGFVFWLGSIRVSSRNPDGPALVAIVTLLGAAALLLVRSARATWRAEWIWWGSAVRPLTRPCRFLLIPAVAVAVVCACFDVAQWLRAPPFWVDEEMIAINLRDRSLADLTGPLWLGQSAPLAWLLVQRLVLLALGSGDLTLRMIPLLFGLGTVAVAVWVGTRWLHPVAAAALVLLCAFGKWLSFFRLEMKHYSADACFALLVPALAAWALEGDERDEERRWKIWWLTATVAQLFSNGGLLVTPMCAAILTWLLLRSRGTQSAMRFAVWGLIWVVAAAANYGLSLQYTHRSTYLRGYWAGALPPESAGIFERFAWTTRRLDDLASDPAGASLAIGFWTFAILGFAFGRKRPLALLFASVPFSTFVFGFMGIVPLSGRLSLWMVPALYAGIALLLDAGVTQTAAAWRTHRRVRLAAGLSAVIASLAVGADILAEGKPVLEFAARRSNHGLDDRAAAKWVMDRRRPGDAIVTTRLGWPALWWYGRIPLGQPRPRGQLTDGSIMYEAVHERARPDCGALTRDALNGRARVLLHVGFPDMPDGFYELMLRQLSPFGRVTELREFANFSRTAIVTLDESETNGAVGESGPRDAHPGELTGCVTFRAARRW